MTGYRVELTHPFQPRKRVLATVIPMRFGLDRNMPFEVGERISCVCPTLAPQRVTALYAVGNTEYQATKRG